MQKQKEAVQMQNLHLQKPVGVQPPASLTLLLHFVNAAYRNVYKSERVAAAAAAQTNLCGGTKQLAKQAWRRQAIWQDTTYFP